MSILYRAEVDGLRAFAVLPVIFFHAGFPLFSGGFIGVDVFFVISGYLITGIILSELTEGRFSIISFYERRARRILPALFFVLLTCLPFAWMYLPPQDLRGFAQSLSAVSIFASNILFWRTSGYFDGSAELKPLLHTWSLAVEEQYYVIFPAFLSFAWTWGRRRIVTILACFAVISLGAAQFVTNWQPNASFYLLPTRIWELLAGAFVSLYFLSNTRTLPPLILNEFGSIAGLSLLIYAIFAFDRNTPYPSLFTLLPVVGTVLVIFCATRKTILGRILGSRFLVGIGLVSFSAYLWHQPLFAFARFSSVGNVGNSVLACLTLTTFILSYFTWRYIERPFRERTKFSQKLIFFYSVFFSVILFCLGLVGYITDGFSNRFISINPTPSIELQRVNSCFLLSANADALNPENCSKSSSGKKFNVLLLGDSHAASLYPGLKDYLAANNVNLGMMTAAYCLPLVQSFPKNRSETATNRCEAINRKIFGFLESNRFDLILVSSYALKWSFSNSVNWSYPGYYDDFRSTMKSLTAKGKILVVGEFLIWDEGLPGVIFREISRSSGGNTESLPDYSSHGLSKNLFYADGVLKTDMATLGAHYVSIVDALCRDGACARFVPSTGGRRLISIDYGHLGLESSIFISQHTVGPAVLKALE